MKPSAGASLIDLANEQVSMWEVCRQIGMNVSDDVILGRASLKMYCPQGELYHGDGGTDPVFRVYTDTNTAFCFRCSKYWTPVSLYADIKGVSRKIAAELLLGIIGYSKPVLDQSLLLTTNKSIDYSALAEALKIFCARACPDWEIVQLDGLVAISLNKCLELLPKVTNSDEASEWLKITKQVMQNAFIEENRKNEL